jgi:hypothetical protein
MSIRRNHGIAPRSVAALVGSGLMALLFAGCPPDDDCQYAGKSHRVGDHFPSTDGCNQCSCTAQGVACTLIACVPSPSDCRRTGCSGQLCADHDVASTCEYRSEYACYLTAACERQADGTCAFTPTDELARCLANGGPGDAGVSCDFSTSYDYGPIGGFVAWTSRSYLSPGNQYRHVRAPVRGSGSTETSCAPAMPPCGAQDIITAYDIEVHDLTSADVRAALAEAPPPLFGYDQRPVDGSVFEFKTAKGSSFLVGSDCGTMAGCRAIPPGIKQLRDRLVALDAQQLSDPACKAAGLSP